MIVDPTAVAAAVALVAGVTQVVKVVAFPDAWHYGRAPLVLAALLALLAVVASTVQAGAGFGDPLGLAAAWLAIYTGSVGAHQTITKIGRVAAGTTDPAGPDVEHHDASRDDLARP